MTVTYEAVLAAHYSALNLGEIPPLLLFVDGVIADVDTDGTEFPDPPMDES